MHYSKIKLLNRWWVAMVWVLLAVLGFSVYANTLAGGFIWDDEYLVQKNVSIRNLANLPLIFKQDVNGSAQESSYAYYRPLTISLYALGYSILGLNVRIYHFINIFVHILTSLSVCYLIYLLFSSRITALFCGLLFLLHPVQTEAVAYISGLADPLSALFIIWSFIFYIEYLKQGGRLNYVLVLISYLLALLAKENGLILAPILLLYHYAFKVRLKIKQFVPLLILTAVYLLFRMNFFRAGLPDSGAFAWASLFGRLPGFFAAITGYFRILFVPVDLHMEYGNALFPVVNLQVITGAAILFWIVSYAFRCRQQNRLFFFSALWFFITLLPCSSVYPVLAFYMAEHYLYLPAIGFFLVISQGLTVYCLRKRTRLLALSAAAILLLMYAYITVKQNNYWKDQVTFYNRTLKYAAQSARVYFNLGRVYGKDLKYAQAIAAYKKAIGIEPGYKEAWFNLALVYFENKQYQLAIECCVKAARLGYPVPQRFMELLKPYQDKNSPGKR